MSWLSSLFRVVRTGSEGPYSVANLHRLPVPVCVFMGEANRLHCKGRLYTYEVFVTSFLM